MVTGKNGKQKERNGSSPIRESVVNIKPDTTMDDLLKYTDKIYKRWGIRAIQIHIHKDEGHYENPDDPSTWKPNLHAHIIWDWMNHETGKSYKLGKKDMEELQDMAAETLEMERGKRKAETGREHLERNDFIIQKQENQIKELQNNIDQEKAEIEKMAKASMFDKMFNSNLSPAVRKAFEEKDEAHKEELRQAQTAVDADGHTFVWSSGDKKGKQLTWEEYMKVREKQYKEEIAKVVAEKEAAIAEKETAVAQMKAEAKTMLANKQESIERLEKELAGSQKYNKALAERLKVVRELILSTFSMNFKKVAQIIVDQWKAGMKHFTKGIKDFLQKAMSSEKTEAGRKSYVNDAFDLAKIMAKTDTCLELEDEALKPLHDDALRIADGTWDSYHEKLQHRDHLFDAAVNALVEMGNCSYQRHLNQEQANAIEAFLAFEDGDRTQLCSDIWDKASPKINYYWRDGTFDALEELRTKELYNCSYSRGRII